MSTSPQGSASKRDETVSLAGIGVELASLKLPFKQGLLTAARLGADAVEIDARGEIQPRQLSDTGLRQLRKMLDDLNLRVSAVTFATRRGYDVADDLERRVTGTREALQFAYRLGAPVVVNSIGRVPDSEESEARRQMMDVLADLGRYSDRVGARLAARTGSESGETLAKLIATAPVGALAVDLDPGGLIVNGFSAQDAAKALGPHIAHVHARDAVRDLAIGRGLEVELGRGSVDFPSLLGQLEEFGYRGFVTVQRSAARDPVREVGDAVAYLKQLGG